ncbi:radical SAM additional 4Fe4S-binding SPASM domain-containing protein [Selenomonas ruminantium]|uniref:Radical SAM additional 4Fe4S-binding SPASM domain-containing protein n=1 Tax=Selenomonas ruminantium TaxID=971 RepID=A0A1M6RHR5_SELRU|nr:SPASM domain-containing protein [Selenomonas ruminantium]SHK31969.1 radical SAM additional 4Fe4S-binding SPASM domain-containing protein [Selenomonas ruminantium]
MGHLTEKREAEEIADLKLLGRIYRLLPARSGVGLVIMPTYDCKKIMPMVSTAYCGAEQGTLVVDPFGRIYSCWDTVAVEDAAVGFTDSQSGRFLMNFAKAKWRTRTADLMPSCEACPYVFVCRGGCAARAFVKHGSYFRESCGKIKDIFAFVAPRIAGEAWAKGKEDELSLSLAELLSHLTEAERQILMESRSQKEILEIVKSAGYMNKGM